MAVPCAPEINAKTPTPNRLRWLSNSERAHFWLPRIANTVVGSTSAILERLPQDNWSSGLHDLRGKAGRILTATNDSEPLDGLRMLVLCSQPFAFHIKKW